MVILIVLFLFLLKKKELLLFLLKIKYINFVYVVFIEFDVEGIGGSGFIECIREYLKNLVSVIISNCMDIYWVNLIELDLIV